MLQTSSSIKMINKVVFNSVSFLPQSRYNQSGSCYSSAGQLGSALLLLAGHSFDWIPEKQNRLFNWGEPLMSLINTHKKRSNVS